MYIHDNVEVSSVLENFVKSKLKYLHCKHRCLSENVANASVPGYRAKDLKAHPDYSDFSVKNSFQGSKSSCVYYDYAVFESKKNGNNVDEKQLYNEVVANESLLSTYQAIYEALYKIKGSIVGL